MEIESLPIPERLTALLNNGIWPTAGDAINAQESRPIVTAEQVRRVAEDETKIVFYPPPFRTVGSNVAAEPTVLNGVVSTYTYWKKHGAIEQLDPELSLVIADFGIGSDAPIILDYREDRSSPNVRRLRWSERGDKNEWVVCATCFDEFADRLGLGRTE